MKYCDIKPHDCDGCIHLFFIDDKRWFCNILLANNSDRRCECFEKRKEASND